jgi:hypothetical protein
MKAFLLSFIFYFHLLSFVCVCLRLFGHEAEAAGPRRSFRLGLRRLAAASKPGRAS